MKRLTIAACLGLVMVIAVGIVRGQAEDGVELPSPIQLSAEEEAWLRDHPVVRVVVDSQWAPVEFRADDGSYQGIAVDFLRRLEELLGIHFEIAEGISWNDGVAAVRDKQLDMIASMSRTAEREAFVRFTDPYLSMPVGIFAGIDVSYIGSLKNLTGKRVATVEGYATSRFLARVHPEIRQVTAPSTADALKMVAAGEVDAFVGNIVTASYYIGKLRLNSVRIAGETSLQYVDRMAVRDDWPVFAEALQKALAAIEQPERDAMYNRWMSIRYEVGFDYTVVWRVIGVAAVILLAVLFWNRRLKTAVDERTAELKATEATHRAQLEELVRVRTEELETQRNRFRQLTTNLPAMVYQAVSFEDGSSRFTYISPQMREVYGVEEEDPAAATEMLFTRVHPDDIDEVAESNRLAIAEGSPWYGVHRIVNPSGEVRWVEGAANPTPGSDGETIWDGLILDITERRQAEEALEKAHNELERRVKERTADLDDAVARLETEIVERLRVEVELREHRDHLEELVRERTLELAEARDRAEAADRIKSAFLATMSHELRTPLNSIVGFTGIMLQGLAGPLNDEQQKQMGMIQRSARHLHALVNDVLDISKIEAGQLECQFAPFDMVETVTKVVNTIRPLAEDKGLDLIGEIASEVGEIDSDQRRVEQILINLVNNAVKFTDRGRVGVSCSVVDRSIVTTVTDTGIGIAEEHLGTLFEPFRQVDTGLDRQREGTGLGLSICQRLVELLGGAITVESRLAEGSSFSVSLPLERPPAEEVG